MKTYWRFDACANKTCEFKSTVPHVNFNLGYCYFSDILQVFLLCNILLK